MRTSGLAFLCVIALLCSSCGNIKNKKVTEANKDEVMSEIGASKDLTEEDRQLLAAYMLRQNLATVFQGGKPGLPTGKTIGEMIEDQRRWVAAEAEKERIEKEKAQKLAAEIAAKEAALRDLVTVTLYSIREETNGFMNGFDARIAFKAGSKDLRAFEGNLVLSDVLGNSLGEIPVKVLKPLKAADTGTINYDNAYMVFPELRGKHLEDIKAQWKPTKIILADSTELSLQEKTD